MPNVAKDFPWFFNLERFALDHPRKTGTIQVIYGASVVGASAMAYPRYLKKELTFSGILAISGKDANRAKNILPHEIGHLLIEDMPYHVDKNGKEYGPEYVMNPTINANFRTLNPPIRKLDDWQCKKMKKEIDQKIY